MTPVPVECPVCRKLLPAGEPVAFMDKQQLIHVSCYRPSPPTRIPRTKKSRAGARHAFVSPLDGAT